MTGTSQMRPCCNYGGNQPLAFVRVGTLDEPSALPPDVDIYTRSKLPWVTLPAEVPAFEVYYDFKKLWPPESLARRKALFGVSTAHRVWRRIPARWSAPVPAAALPLTGQIDPLLPFRLAPGRKECPYERVTSRTAGACGNLRPRPPTGRRCNAGPVITHPSTNRASASKWDHFSAVEERPHPFLSNGPIKLGVCVLIGCKWFLPKRWTCSQQH